MKKLIKRLLRENLDNESLKNTRIVGDDGNPLLVYRSQKNDRKQGITRQSNMKGIYFSADADSTKIYGDNTQTYYLNIQNPIILKDTEWNLSLIPEYIYNMLISKGYDGAVWLRHGVMYEIVAFYENQIFPV